MRLPITFASAVAIHAVAAVGAVTLGTSHGKGAVAVLSAGPTIDIDTSTSPVRDDEPVAIAKAAVTREAARGAPNPIHVVARAPSQSADEGRSDIVPIPVPTVAEPTRFKMGLAARVGSTSGTGAVAQIATTTDVVADSDVTERAQKIGGAPPVYPAEAHAQSVELAKPLEFEIVVDPSGTVASARELGHVGYGFDEAAATALRAYRFSPAKRNGHAVAVRMKWQVEFRFD
jgi:protein TonB